MQKAMRRRRFFGRFLSHGLGLVGMGLLQAASEPLQPVVERLDVPVPDLPLAFDGVRIAHLSDLHVQKAFPAERLEPMVSLALAESPDMLALTGDYIWDREEDLVTPMEACARALTPLARACPLGAFCVFGNHDFPTPLSINGRDLLPADPSRTPWLRAGVFPLCDECRPVRREKAELWICGLRSAISRATAPGPVLAQAPLRSCRIALWHEPDRATEARDAGAGLMLSGHTHGGQLNPPLLGPLKLPTLGRRYIAGLYFLGMMPLYVTRGIGVLPPRLRLFCPPEISILTLRRSRW